MPPESRVIIKKAAQNRHIKSTDIVPYPAPFRRRNGVQPFQKALADDSYPCPLLKHVVGDLVNSNGPRVVEIRLNKRGELRHDARPPRVLAS